MPRSSTRPFANLREWCQWLADNSASMLCCQLVTDLDDIRVRRDRFNCDTCDHQQRWSALWSENRIAWHCYQELRHRTVRDLQASVWVLDQFTAGWSWQRKADLLRRLDLILEVLAPTEPPESHGRRTAT
jgi:hypothetical protein